MYYSSLFFLFHQPLAT